MPRKLQFFLFFSIALSIYGLINFYVFLRGWEAFQSSPRLMQMYISLFLTLSLSYVVGRTLERFFLNWISSTLVWIGAFWLAAMCYFVLLILTIDLLRLVLYILPFPNYLFHGITASTKEALGLGFCGLIALVITGGYINTLHPRIKRLEIPLSKNNHALSSLHVAVASDIHLGTIICKSRLQHIVEEINNLDPDLVLLPGDVVDEDLGPVIRQNLGETIRKIKSQYGVFAVTGNHEYIGGVEEAVRYLEEHGVTVLRDSTTCIAESLYIVGREDVSISQFAGKQRKPIDELLSGLKDHMPIILMDHQPLRLDEAADHGVDLQLSGHTHYGQIWPFNFITNAVYELSWGYKKKENTHIYVSCGVGTWGPPVRIGHRPEIVSLRLRFV